uniref:Uncharacterized protein n=1 Tax=Cucumis melo TaxID=3656 RepID=A0A9I9CCC1_CUCME
MMFRESPWAKVGVLWVTVSVYEADYPKMERMASRWSVAANEDRVGCGRDWWR